MERQTEDGCYNFATCFASTFSQLYYGEAFLSACTTSAGPVAHCAHAGLQTGQEHGCSCTWIQEDRKFLKWRRPVERRWPTVVAIVTKLRGSRSLRQVRGRKPGCRFSLRVIWHKEWKRPSGTSAHATQNRTRQQIHRFIFSFPPENISISPLQASCDSALKDSEASLPPQRKDSFLFHADTFWSCCHVEKKTKQIKAETNAFFMLRKTTEICSCQVTVN